MMWKKGNKIIAISDKLYDKRDEERIVIEKVPNGNILSIRLAEEDDAGEYLCQVTAAETIELVHDVQIRGDKLNDDSNGRVFTHHFQSNQRL